MKRRIKLDVKTPSEKGLKLLKFMLSIIKGQDRPVKHLADAIEDYESELFTENRPIYIGMYCGPSGVGKTLTAELLAEYWFGNRKAFTKINCAEFSESHGVSELKGSPAGYRDHFNPEDEKPGTTPILWQGNIDKYALNADPNLAKIEKSIHAGTEEILKLNNDLAEQIVEIVGLIDDKGKFNIEDWSALKKILREAYPTIAQRQKIISDMNRLEHTAPFVQIKRPKSIILFDEIEKAHPDMHEILLGIMDKAEFRLANGSITDFSNSVILMTSNVGSSKIAGIQNPKRAIGYLGNDALKKDIEAKDEEIYRTTLEELKKVFSPEFMGRIDDVNVYRPLGPEILRQIVDVELLEFQKGIPKNFPISLIFDEKVKEFILKESLDKPEEGIRLLKKKIRKYLRGPLCLLKNKGLIKERDVIHVTLDKKSQVVFKKAEEVNKEKKD